MKKSVFRLLYVTFIFLSLQTCAWSQAPVVNDSDNFILLDGEKADFNLPASKQIKLSARDDEDPLVHEDNPVKTQNTPGLYNKIQGLQQEVQELRGQLEIQAHELKQLKEQSTTYYRDLDTRLRNNVSQTTPVAPTASQQPQPAPAQTPQPQQQLQATNSVVKPSSDAIAISASPADEEISYMTAYDLIKHRQFDEALKAMQHFITLYPNGGYAANAHYWLGELYLVKKDYAQAIIQFERVNQQFPKSSKAAPSLLKLGYAIAATGKKDEAKQKLNKVIKTFPGTASAQLAQEKLKLL